jgi:uncharacterized membrane protein
MRLIVVIVTVLVGFAVLSLPVQSHKVIHVCEDEYSGYIPITTTVYLNSCRVYMPLVMK